MPAKGQKKEKEPLLDMLNRPLSIGDAVAFRHSRFKMLECGRVIGFTNRMVRIGWTVNGHESSYLVRTEDCAIISLDDYMMHALSRI